MIARFRDPQPTFTLGLMTFEGVALAAWTAVVVLSVLGVGLIFVLGAAAPALTVARARRRRRLPYDLPGELARGCAVNDLAEIDEALQRILAEEHGAISGWR